MIPEKDYINWIRSKVGSERIFLNFAGGIVVNDHGEILLQKRSKTKNRWGFPGGAMNIGESAEETAIREIQEETGYIVRVERLLGVYTKYFEKNRNNHKFQPIVIVFKMIIIGGEAFVDGVETFDIKFFNIDQTPRLYSQLHTDILYDYKSNLSCMSR